MAVLALGAEHDELRVSVDPHVVSGWPVEQIIRIDRLLRAIRIGRGDPSAQDEAPVGALAAITLQALEERGRIDPRRQREILAADLAESARVAEVRSLTDHGAWNLHLHFHVLFRYPHARISSSKRVVE